MQKFGKNERRKKKKLEISTFTIPFTMGLIEENISINTNPDNKLSKEELINYGLKAQKTGNIKEATKYYNLFINKRFKDAGVFSNYGIKLNSLG